MRIARLVTREFYPSEQSVAEAFAGASGRLGEYRADILVTPGGFLHTEAPAFCSRIPCGWQSKPNDLARITDWSTEHVRKVSKHISRLSGGPRVVTIGLDLTASPRNNFFEAELVAVYDLAEKAVIAWTGKSYPTTYQEESLFQVKDIETHFVRIGSERILVLGCHDLNIFSPRARANQRKGSDRFKTCEAFTRKTQEFDPTLILQHPHTTDTANIWAVGWSGIRQAFPKARYCSGICYSNRGAKPRQPLKDVLKRTKSDQDIMDIVIQ